MIFQVRTARPSIVMNGTDFFQKLAPYFLNLSYTDNCDGERADDLQMQLADRDNRFISDWMPDKGAFIDVGIIAERWFAPNAAALRLDCGRFWLDEIEFELPQHTVSIKGSSIPTDGHIKAANETRGWDKTTLQQIANQIATENKLTVDWQGEFDPKYSRVEQTEQSGLEFLKQRAKDAKLCIKMYRGKMIFLDEQKLEEAAPAFQVIYGEGMPGGALQALGALAPLAAGGSLPTGARVYRMAGGKFTTKLIDTAKKATVSYAALPNGKVSTGEHIDGDEKAVDDWHTNINQSTDCEDEDEDGEGDGEGNGGGTAREAQPISQWNQPSASSTVLAKSKLRDKNKDRFHAEIELSIGNPLVAAGQVFTLQGMGKYDGNWFVESVQHKLAPTYTTTLQARACLKGF
jgi:phage protein D